MFGVVGLLYVVLAPPPKVEDCFTINILLTQRQRAFDYRLVTPSSFTVYNTAECGWDGGDVSATSSVTSQYSRPH